MGHCTFSLLPDHLAARFPGTLSAIEQVVATVQAAPTLVGCVEQLRPDPVSLPSALRWIHRRLRLVYPLLPLVVTLLPEQLAHCEPTVAAMRQRLSVPWLLLALRALLCTLLQMLSRALGFAWVQLQRLRDPHLPQGAPTSPALANLCAFRLDLRLDGLAYVLGARYARYADDLVYSGDEHLRRVAPRIEKWVGKIAFEEGFALSHLKTRCLSQGQRQTVCGIVVNERLSLRREEFDRLKAILHQCATSGPSAQNQDKVDLWEEVLRGRVAWAHQLNPTKAARLKNLFDRIDWSR